MIDPRFHTTRRPIRETTMTDVSDAPPTGLERLLAIEDISRLKYRYLRGLDQKQWDEVASCFLPDATAAYSGGKYAFEGRDAILDFLTRAMSREDFLSSHRCTHPEIDVLSSTAATGIWALDDTVIIGEYDVIVHGAAFYRDEYECVDGSWFIRHTGYERTFEQLLPRGSIPGLTLTASWWATGGQSTLPGPE
jgi:hypothetical protein